MNFDNRRIMKTIGLFNDTVSEVDVICCIMRCDDKIEQ
jgi:hypothetical protein